MKVEEALEKIDRLVEENISDKRGYFSQRVGYELTLKETNKIGGEERVRDVFGWIKDKIERGRKPENKRVRKHACAICLHHSEDVPRDSFLWA